MEGPGAASGGGHTQNEATDLPLIPLSPEIKAGRWNPDGEIRPPHNPARSGDAGEAVCATLRSDAKLLGRIHLLHGRQQFFIVGMRGSQSLASRKVVSADSEHVELLRRGPRPWNEWRRRHPTTVPNLTQISLSAGERQMGPVHGGPINLASARLRRACLRFATLTGADLEEADLSAADLTDARLDGANLANADLSHAVLARTDFEGARFYRTKLNGANLQEAKNLTQEQLDESSGDASTDLPAHLKSPASWMVFEAKSGAEPTDEAGTSASTKVDGTKRQKLK